MKRLDFLGIIVAIIIAIYFLMNSPF